MIISVRFLNDFELLFLWTHDRRVADTYFQSICRLSYYDVEFGQQWLSIFRFVILLCFVRVCRMIKCSPKLNTLLCGYSTTYQDLWCSLIWHFNLSVCFVCIDTKFAAIIFRLCPRWFGQWRSFQRYTYSNPFLYFCSTDEKFRYLFWSLLCEWN